MKKKLFILSSLALIGILAATNVYLQDRENLSDVLLNNAAAIASGESSIGTKGPGSLSLCPKDLNCTTTILLCLGVENPCQEIVCSMHDKGN